MKTRKWKCRQYQNILVEDDDESVNIVTIKEVSTDTSRGPIKKRIEFPFRPVNQAGPSAHNNILQPTFLADNKDITLDDDGVQTHS